LTPEPHRHGKASLVICYEFNSCLRTIFKGWGPVSIKNSHKLR
jgi:hypothetical protein